MATNKLRRNRHNYEHEALQSISTFGGRADILLNAARGSELLVDLLIVDSNYNRMTADQVNAISPGIYTQFEMTAGFWQYKVLAIANNVDIQILSQGIPEIDEHKLHIVGVSLGRVFDGEYECLHIARFSEKILIESEVPGYTFCPSSLQIKFNQIKRKEINRRERERSRITIRS